MPQPFNPDEHDPVLERARALPAALPPSSDLWPGIERKLSTQTQKRWTTGRLVSAAIILIGISSVFTLKIADMLEAPANIESATATHFAKFGPWTTGGTDIVQARTDLLLTVEAELTELSPQTWEILTINLNNIETARREISVALEGNPDSELLQHLLLSTFTNEYALLTQVGTMTRSAQQRIKL